MTSRLEKIYKEEVVPALMKQFGYTNPMEVPKLVKVTLNMGVGEAATNKKILENAVADMTKISGQKPVVTKARNSIAGFKVRENMPIGAKVTLRGARMYEFLDRLDALALPRVRDFRGIRRKAFDGHGNYSLGLTEQLVFPELNPDKYTRTQGMNITLVTSSDSDQESLFLFEKMIVPHQRDASCILRWPHLSRFCQHVLQGRQPHQLRLFPESRQLFQNIQTDI